MSSTSRGWFGSHSVVASSDLDAARQALSEAYLPMDFPSASASMSLDLSLNVIKIGRVTAGYLHFGDALRIQTVEASNYHVDIPIAGTAEMRAGSGRPVHCTPRTAAIFAPGLPAELDCDEEFAQVALMLPESELQFELESLLGHGLRTPLTFSTELNLASAAGSAVMQVLRTVDAASSQEGGLLQHPLASHRLEQVLMQSLLFAQSHNFSESLRVTPPLAGTGAVRAAVDLMQAVQPTPGLPPSLRPLRRRAYVACRRTSVGLSAHRQ